MSKPTIICFGEVLWDMLPTGPVAGGAPMNVAFHANQLGLSSQMISRVGEDDLGSELKQFLRKIGVSIELVQTDSTHPTGTVNVTLAEGGSPSYEIVGPVAWDYIQPDDKVREKLKSADAFVFGSLSCRTERNKQTLLEYAGLASLRVFDVNLRPPYFSKKLIEELLAQADLVKMNDEELGLIAGWLGADGGEAAQMDLIKTQFGLDLLILTRGKNGAACLGASGFHEHPGFRVEVQDTIGSGDSFLAAFLSKFLKGGNMEQCLAFAGAVGAIVATKQGGTPSLTLADIEGLMQSQGS